jgi:hypothetical protein
MSGQGKARCLGMAGPGKAPGKLQGDASGVESSWQDKARKVASARQGNERNLVRAG